jgi:hypothetical protein
MDYITCNHTKSKFRINVKVCEVCTRMAKCADYQDYIQPSLFAEGLGHKRITGAMYRRKKRRKAVRPEAFEDSEKAEQLTLNI